MQEELERAERLIQKVDVMVHEVLSARWVVPLALTAAYKAAERVIELVRFKRKKSCEIAAEAAAGDI